MAQTTILTVIDRFSKAAHFIPVPKLLSAFETAQLLVQHIFRIHGIPSNVVSDRGSQFVSQVWRDICNALEVLVSLTSSYHHQSNVQAEQCNQQLEATLRGVVESNTSAWSKHLVWVEYAHNTHTSSATGLSPFEASVSYSPLLFASQKTDISVPSVQHHLRRCRRAWCGPRRPYYKPRPKTRG